MKPLFSVFILLFLLGTALINGTGCANIMSPTGGDRDSLPPVLRSANPKDSSLGFKSRSVVFTFNEYLGDLQDIQNNVLISPTPERLPEITTKLKTLTVKFKDTLEENTTYSINFGDAIKDYTEGNVLKNFTYIFSTGDALDSLELEGKVLLAETGKTDTTMVVMLHTSGEDSAVVEKRPRYIAKLDGTGHFHFHNLPPGTFYIYALKDEGGQRRYLSPKQLFAFAGEPVVTNTQKEPITLFAYKEEKETAAPSLAGLSVGGGNRGGGANERRLRFETTIMNGVFDQLQEFSFTFPVPVKNFDSAKVSLFTDSFAKQQTITSFLRDTTNKKITLQTTWKPNTLYSLVVDKDFAEDTGSRKLLKSDTISFRTKKENEYGALKLKLKNLELDKNPVLQLFAADGKMVKSMVLVSADISLPLFAPGEYELRILFDDNKNGKWDPGSFFGKKQQPELVMPVERKLTVKANWDNEAEISL